MKTTKRFRKRQRVAALFLRLMGKDPPPGNS